MDSLTSAEYCMVWVSAASEAEAMTLARAVVELKLAACVSIMPITSIYSWKAKIAQEAEWQLMIKTKRVCFDALSQKITELHSYEVPEVIATPIVAGSPAYLSWIEANVQSSG
jgi:periplasmic divalent cation tolerance protein